LFILSITKIKNNLYLQVENAQSSKNPFSANGRKTSVVRMNRPKLILIKRRSISYEAEYSLEN